MKSHYIIGCLAGWALWLVFVAIDMAYALTFKYVPKEVRAVTDVVVGMTSVAAWPLGMGGWLVWGEGWHLRPIPNLAVSMALYGALGVTVAAFIQQRRLHGQRDASAS
jgi:hypothetical protein